LDIGRTKEVSFVDRESPRENGNAMIVNLSGAGQPRRDL
jgi:hypothetical protein